MIPPQLQFTGTAWLIPDLSEWEEGVLARANAPATEGFGNVLEEDISGSLLALLEGEVPLPPGTGERELLVRHMVSVAERQRVMVYVGSLSLSLDGEVHTPLTQLVQSQVRVWEPSHIQPPSEWAGGLARAAEGAQHSVVVLVEEEVS